MQEIAVITVLSNDKPGVIDALAQCAKQHGGNWLESKLAQMAGKFVGVIRISVDKSEFEALTQSLNLLKSQGIYTTCEAIYKDIEAHTNAKEINGSDSNIAHLRASFHAIGPDRKGIIKELSSAFLAKNINVDTLETKLSSMPYSGDPLFEAAGTVDIPEGGGNNDKRLNELHQQLDDIADDLGIDISLSIKHA